MTYQITPEEEATEATADAIVAAAEAAYLIDGDFAKLEAAHTAGAALCYALNTRFIASQA